MADAALQPLCTGPAAASASANEAAVPTMQETPSAATTAAESHRDAFFELCARLRVHCAARDAAWEQLCVLFNDFPEQAVRTARRSTLRPVQLVSRHARA